MKIPDISRQSNDKMRQANKKDKTRQKMRKQDCYNRSNANLVTMKSEDKVLLSQKKTSVDPTFNPALYKLMKIDSTILTLQRGDTVITRNLSKMMLVITGAEVKNKEHDIDNKDDQEVYQ